jgi:hypothetical protein
MIPFTVLDGLTQCYLAYNDRSVLIPALFCLDAGEIDKLTEVKEN